MTLIEQPIEKKELLQIAKERFGDWVKAVVDIERAVMVVGGELHADEEALLLEQESQQQHLWGINLYPNEPNDSFIEFDSMINLRPSQNNYTRGVDDPLIRLKIIGVVNKLIRESK